MPQIKDGGGDRLTSLRAFFEAAGVEFTSDEPTGVRLQKSD